MAVPDPGQFANRELRHAGDLQQHQHDLNAPADPHPLVTNLTFGQRRERGAELFRQFQNKEITREQWMAGRHELRDPHHGVAMAGMRVPGAPNDPFPQGVPGGDNNQQGQPMGPLDMMLGRVARIEAAQMQILGMLKRRLGGF